MGRALVTHDTVVGTYNIHLKGGFSVSEKANFQNAIATIKTFIPASDRTYDSSTFAWTILDKYWAIIQPALVSLNFIINYTSPQTHKHSVNEAEYKANFFYDTAPAPSVEDASSIAKKLSAFLGVEITSQELAELKKLYRQKARSLHPDLGGDAKQMSELNRLWTLYTAGGVQ